LSLPIRRCQRIRPLLAFSATATASLRTMNRTPLASTGGNSMSWRSPRYFQIVSNGGSMSAAR
jgi:hypothetical protein